MTGNLCASPEILTRCIVKLPVLIVLSGSQNCSFTLHNVYAVCLALFFFTLATLCPDSIGLRLKFLNVIFESLPKVLACPFRMLILAFSLRMARLRAVWAKV